MMYIKSALRMITPLLIIRRFAIGTLQDKSTPLTDESLIQVLFGRSVVEERQNQAQCRIYVPERAVLFGLPCRFLANEGL